MLETTERLIEAQRELIDSQNKLIENQQKLIDVLKAEIAIYQKIVGEESEGKE